MTPRAVHAADSVVIEACARRGVTVTARQLERWRRCLPERERQYMPGYQGSRTVNPNGYVDQVVAVHGLIESGVPLREIPLVLFSQGFPVALDVLREAYLDIFTRLRRAVDAIADQTSVGPATPQDKADLVAGRMARQRAPGPLARRWMAGARSVVRNQRSAGSDDSMSLLTAALSALLTGFVSGRPASPDGIVEALDVVGLNDGRDPDHVAQTLASMNLDACEAAVTSATARQWATARDDLTALVEYATVRRRWEMKILPDEKQLTGLDLAEIEVNRVGYATWVVISLLLDDEWRQSLRSELEQFRALDQLYDELPEKFRRLLRPGHEEAN